MSHIKFTIALTMMALFSLALITFAVEFSNQNTTAYSVGDGKTDLKSNVNSTLYTWASGINTSSNALVKSEVTSENLQTGTQLRGGQDDALNGSKAILSDSFKVLFGKSNGFAIIFTSLFALISYIGILYWYKAWIGRNPD